MSIRLYSEILIFWLVEKKPPRVTYINFLQRISIENKIKRKGCENYEIDHLRENALIFYEILTTYSLWKWIETGLENVYLDIEF